MMQENKFAVTRTRCLRNFDRTIALIANRQFSYIRRAEHNVNCLAVTEQNAEMAKSSTHRDIQLYRRMPQPTCCSRSSADDHHFVTNDLTARTALRNRVTCAEPRRYEFALSAG